MFNFLPKSAGHHGPLKGIPSCRQEPCRICGTGTGIKIAQTKYWNLHKADIIQCPDCGLIQLDPMPSPTDLESGCNAFYFYERLQSCAKEQKRNLVRNFRRGILYGHHLKRRGYAPSKILELGAGSGYFSAGLREIFPESTVTVVDIVDEVLKGNRTAHGFTVFKGSPEDLSGLKGMKYDLVIARDLLEHVRDIGLAIRNITEILVNGGLFHFITPNGREDVWKHYIHSLHDPEPSEILINHLNYFDGSGLENLLKKNGLVKIEYYSYSVKSMLRGAGWSRNIKQAAPVSVGRSASGQTSDRIKPHPDEVNNKSDLLNAWYLKPGRNIPRFMVSWYMHRQLVRIPPQWKIGHEFCGLFKRSYTN
jgi:ubiquinone/menaquinone biosynthesis C-methylase UbiE